MNAEIKKALATRQKNRSQLLDDLIREKEESKRLRMLATQRGYEIERLRKLLRKFLDLHLEDQTSGDTLFGVVNLRIEAREALEGKEWASDSANASNSFLASGLNASKRGISARIGGHGLTANISQKGRALDRRATAETWMLHFFENGSLKANSW
jgi:hypothetical protein